MHLTLDYIDPWINLGIIFIWIVLILQINDWDAFRFMWIFYNSFPLCFVVFSTSPVLNLFLKYFNFDALQMQLLSWFVFRLASVRKYIWYLSIDFVSRMLAELVYCMFKTRWDLFSMLHQKVYNSLSFYFLLVQSLKVSQRWKLRAFSGFSWARAQPCTHTQHCVCM